MKVFRTKCIDFIQVNETNCLKHLEASTAFVTKHAMNLGYDKVSELVHTMKDQVPEIKKKLDDLSSDNK